MYIELIVFIVLQVLALAFFAETLRRVIQRSREFPIQEDAFTLPFGFVRLRYLVIFYIVCYIGWVIFSLWIYFTLIDPGSFASSSTPSPGLIDY